MSNRFIELREDALADFFKQELNSLQFLPKANYPEIEKKLSIIASNEERKHKKIEATRWLWKFIVEKALRSITENLRGYNELCNFFDQYVKYENLLFELDKSHRDHVIHSIWVMLIGLYLRRNVKTFQKMDYSDLVVNLCEDQKTGEKKVKLVFDMLRERETALWCLIALTHDLGYPIQKTRNANEIMAHMLSNFGFLEMTDFKYSFTIVHQTAIAELLNTIASVVAYVSDKCYKVGSLAGARVDYAKSLERFDHGIMSAYLLQMYLDFICESMGVVQGLPEVGLWEDKDAVEATTVIALLRTISAHTNRNFYSDRMGCIPVLLILSDELEEFSRYARSIQTDEWINVGYRTEFKCNRKNLAIRYTLDKSEVVDDILEFFKEKVDKLWEHFELSSQEIKSISITCADVRRSPPITYIYRAKTDPVPFKNVEKTSGGTSDNIQGFLDGTVDL